MAPNGRLAAAVQGLLGLVFVFVFSSFTFLSLTLDHLACMASAASLLCTANIHH
jgi:hypothetical protein